MKPAISARSTALIEFAVLLLLAASLLTASEVQAADVSAGQTFFSHCAACHSTSPGVTKIGPSLAGIVGSKSGAVPGFNFSEGMKNANLIWDAASLDKFLANPNGVVRGTRMFFRVSNATDRQNVIAYLSTLKP